MWFPSWPITWTHKIIWTRSFEPHIKCINKSKIFLKIRIRHNFNFVHKYWKCKVKNLLQKSKLVQESENFRTTLRWTLLKNINRIIIIKWCWDFLNNLNWKIWLLTIIDLQNLTYKIWLTISLQNLTPYNRLKPTRITSDINIIRLIANNRYLILLLPFDGFIAY